MGLQLPTLRNAQPAPAIEQRQTGAVRNRSLFLPPSEWSITLRNWVSSYILPSPVAGLLSGMVGADEISLEP